jgi:hypothetical protein
MKKFLLGVAMMVGFISLSHAQTAAPAKSESKKMPAKHVTTTQTVAKKPMVVTAPAVTTTTTTKKMSTTQPATAPAVVVKKDGTPDMRYKKNKKS